MTTTIKTKNARGSKQVEFDPFNDKAARDLSELSIKIADEIERLDELQRYWTFEAPTDGETQSELKMSYKEGLKTLHRNQLQLYKMNGYRLC